MSTSSIHSGIASVELMDVVTTGRARVPADLLPTRPVSAARSRKAQTQTPAAHVLHHTARFRQEGVQSTISFEVVEDIQVAHPAFKKMERGLDGHGRAAGAVS